MAKFDLISDIHLDFTRVMEEFSMASLFPEVHGDYLLVAGDICSELCKPNNDTPKWFFENALKRYKKVYCVLGNHDYWTRQGKNGTLHNMSDLAATQFADDRIQILENRMVEVEDVKLIGATLWTDIPPYREYYVFTRMNDYNFIYQDEKFLASVKDTKEANKKSFEFIQKYVEENPDEKIVILTHHCPSFRSGDKRNYYDRTMTCAYCNNYDDWIENHPNIKCWCHGHVHDESDYKIGETRVVANPCGYIFTEGSGRYLERVYDNGVLENWCSKALEV